jgi:hypothetical protein
LYYCSLISLNYITDHGIVIFFTIDLYLPSLKTLILLFMLQFTKENPLELDLPAIKLEEHEDVTEEAVLTSLKRAISRFSTLQAHDGHWPGDYGGPMFLMPGLVIT